MRAPAKLNANMQGIDRYTPDFWFPGFSLWIEIKPGLQSDAYSKCYRLAIESRHHVLLIQGEPWHHSIDLFDPTARRKFEFRTVVSREEEKPSRGDFRLREEFLHRDVLTLENYSTHETVAFMCER